MNRFFHFPRMSSIIFKVPATRWRLPLFPLLPNRPPTKPEPPSRLLSPPSAPPTALTGEFSTIPPTGDCFPGDLQLGNFQPEANPQLYRQMSPLLLPRVPPRRDPTGEFSTRPPIGVLSSRLPTGEFPTRGKFPVMPPDSPLLPPRVPPRRDPTGEFSTRPPIGVPPKTDASGRSSRRLPSGKFPSKLLFPNNPNKSRFSVEDVPRIK